MELVSPKLINALAKQSAIANRDFGKDQQSGISDVEADGLNVFATLYGPDSTPYADGVFKLKMSVIPGSDFPTTPPKMYFLTKIFHPNVATNTGDICVNALQKDWDPKNWSLTHIFRVIRCLLIIPFPESALNPEAGKLFMESYKEFWEHAQMLTKLHAKDRRGRPQTQLPLVNNSSSGVHNCHENQNQNLNQNNTNVSSQENNGTKTSIGTPQKEKCINSEVAICENNNASVISRQKSNNIQNHSQNINSNTQTQSISKATLSATSAQGQNQNTISTTMANGNTNGSIISRLNSSNQENKENASGGNSLSTKNNTSSSAPGQAKNTTKTKKSALRRL